MLTVVLLSGVQGDPVIICVRSPVHLASSKAQPPHPARTATLTRLHQWHQGGRA